MANKLLTFSPPAKAAEPAVEEAVLLLQPFSEAPQINFERVPVGREAVRQLRVINPSQSEHMVTLSGALSQKGFSVDAQVFKVLPGQHHLVTFAWKPDGKEAASRVALTVTSDKGFKGRCVLLGTVKSQPPKPVRRVQRPTMNVLTTSQQHNLILPVPANPKSCKKAAPPLKPTVPKEFCARTKKSTFASCSSLFNQKTSQVPATAHQEVASKVAASVKLVSSTFTLSGSKESLLGSSPGSGDMLMRASTCKPTMPVLDPAEHTVKAREAVALEPASAVFEDSLEVEEKAGLATSKSILNEGDSQQGQNDTFELDLSFRMERLYQQVQEKKSSGDGPDSTSELDLSAHLTSLYEEIQERKSKQHALSPEQVSSKQLLPEPTCFEERNARQVLPRSCTAKTSLEVSPLCKRLASEHVASSPRRASQEGVQLPDIQDILDELELCGDLPQDSSDAGSLLEMLEKYGSGGLLEEHVPVEDFFPSDISSINGPPGNSTGHANGP